MGIRERLALADYRACLALADARKAENAAARARCMGNAELAAELLRQAERRGEPGIDWPGYFTRLGIA